MTEMRLTRQTQGAVGRLAESFGDSVRHLFWGLPTYAWMLGGKHPQRLLASPSDPWTGSAAAGAAVLSGTCSYAGEEIGLDEDAVWERVDEACPAHAAHLHSFRWLRDLAQVADKARARACAERLTRLWLDRYRDWHGTAWAPGTLGERILFWTFHAPLVLSSQDLVYRSLVLNALARQARHLQRAAPRAPEGVESVRAFSGLVAAGLLVPGCAPPERTLLSLERALGGFILADGGPMSRNVRDSLEIVEILLMVRAALNERSEPVPNWLMVALDRIVPYIRAHRHANGALAQFHGAYADDGILAETVLARTDADGSAQENAPHSGFQRLSARRSLVLFDVGPPPACNYAATGHSAPLSFEFSDGTEPIVVNLGGTHTGWAGDRSELSELARATAAHSTLVIADTNVIDVKPGRGLGDAVLSTRFGRLEAEEGLLVDADHDGYVPRFGVVHRRRLFLSNDGGDLRGEDGLVMSASKGGKQSFAIRFHLHPAVSASTTGNGDGVLLKLENGRGWRFKASGAVIALEESLYCGRPDRVRKSKQIVLSGAMSGAESTAKWSFRRVESEK